MQLAGVIPRSSRCRGWLLACLALALPAGALGAVTTLIATGSVWKYLDGGTDPGPAWRQAAFDDSLWPAGLAQLGYGDGDERTRVSDGIEPKPVTLYFRHTLVWTNPTSPSSLTARLLCDDGAVVYVNGNEIFRVNMPGSWGSPVTPTTPAVMAVDGAGESQYRQRGAYYIWPGTNVVAVEVHQADGEAHDASFDLELVAGLPIVPPVVTWASPFDGEVLPFAPVELSVTTADVDGHVYRVEYTVSSAFAGTVSLGFSEQEPFGFTWQPPGWGRYALTARAIDNSGRSAISAPAHVTVGSPAAIALTRGPYLQSGSTTGLVVRWRTDWFTDAWVTIGPTPEQMDRGFTNTGASTEHAVRLTGLAPGTRHYYRVGYSNQVLASGPDQYFVTAPATNKPTRIWVIGDFGTGDFYQAAVRDAYLSLEQAEGGGRPTDFWLMLGDNAYETGTDAEYQHAVFDVYGSLLRRSVVWPTIGNHDAGGRGVTEEFPYLEIFDLPRQGEAGGVASGTERFYSFDHGNIHVVCLDSQSSARAPGSPMLTWLEQDLAATSADWILAFWHHPPYSFGTHNSDWEHTMVEMRQYVLPVLEAYGVDVVLTGHSHVYERSFLLNGHYGPSQSLLPSMVLDDGSGREEEDRPYRKAAGGLGAHQGAVYVVCGCSGQGGFFNFARHPAKAVNLAGFGSVILDIDGLHLRARFLTHEGAIEDGFSIVKGQPAPGVRPELRLSHGMPGQASIAWPTSLAPFGLEQASAPGVSPVWTPVSHPVTLLGRSNVVTVPLSSSNAVFRLRSTP